MRWIRSCRNRSTRLLTHPPMTPTQLELTRLLGSKELTLGCMFKQSYTEGFETVIYKVVGWNFHSVTERWIAHFPHVSQITEIIGHPATLTDFHRWLVDKCLIFEQRALSFVVKDVEMNLLLEVSYLSSKPLLDQEEATLSAILNLVKSNESLRSQ